MPDVFLLLNDFFSRLLRFMKDVEEHHRRCCIKKLFIRFCYIHKETPALESLFKFIKKRLQHRCFPVNIAKFLRKTILKKIRE